MKHAWTTLALLALGAATLHAAPKDAPNIVFILADDLGSGDLGCYNKTSKIPTPNMDRLAKEGMRFTDAHSPSSVCTPTRYGILTGRYCWRTKLQRGVLQGYDPMLLEPDRLTVAAFLKKHGYATACVGKWHLGFGKLNPVDYSQKLTPGPLSAGFDYWFGIPSSLDFPPYVFVENEKALEEPTNKIEASESQRTGGKGFWRAGAIAPSFRHVDVLPKITEKALAFIEKQTKDAPGKPFFLYFPLTGPHTPWLPLDKYQGKSKAGPYGDFAVQVDDTIGAVLDLLDRLKLKENTLVILTSDNGAHWTPEDIKKYDHRSNMNWRGQKSDAWEAGHRIPFLARWPGKIKPETVCNQTICLTDLLATSAGILGEPLPKDAGEDSFSILPALLDPKHEKPLREATVHHSGAGLFAVRQGKWKYIDGLGSGGFSKPQTEKPVSGGPTGQLYDLEKDPEETENLFAKEADTVKRLQGLLEKYKKDGRSRPAN